MSSYMDRVRALRAEQDRFLAKGKITIVIGPDKDPMQVVIEPRSNGDVDIHVEPVKSDPRFDRGFSVRFSDTQAEAVMNGLFQLFAEPL